MGPPGMAVATPLTTEDIEAVKKVSGVKNVIRRNIKSGKLEFNDKVVFGMAANVPDGEERELVYELMNIEEETGRLLQDGDSKKVVLGYNFYADKVGLEKKVKPGDEILIQDEKFEVIGITKKLGSFLFDNMVLMNDDDLEELMGYGDEVDTMAVIVKDKRLMEKVKLNIEKVLRKKRDVEIGEEDFEVSTPEAALATVNQVLFGVQAFVVIIAFISIIVGAIGIINTMTTSVLERRKEIGIMKAIGAKNSHIFLMFFIESGLMGLIGGIIGVILGVSIGYFGTLQLNNFIGSNASPNLDLFLITASLIGSFLIGSVAGIIPAMQAAKQNPVDALRG